MEESYSRESWCMMDENTWDNLNSLLAFLRKDVALINNYYNKLGNPIPEFLIKEQIIKAEKILDKYSLYNKFPKEEWNELDALIGLLKTFNGVDIIGQYYDMYNNDVPKSLIQDCMGKVQLFLDENKES